MCVCVHVKLVPPLYNTTFQVVFLARHVGGIENTLYIHSSKGSFKYQVCALGLSILGRVHSIYDSICNMVFIISFYYFML